MWVRPASGAGMIWLWVSTRLLAWPAPGSAPRSSSIRGASHWQDAPPLCCVGHCSSLECIWARSAAMSMDVQCSTSWPSLIRKMSMNSSVTVLPVGGRSQISPRWVPRTCRAASCAWPPDRARRAVRRSPRRHPGMLSAAFRRRPGNRRRGGVLALSGDLLGRSG
jgi:hypothetical protein